MTINSGIAQYTTPRPFDSASAQVTLHYTIEPGEDPDAVATHVGQMARRHAIAMLAMLSAPAAPVAVKFAEPVTFAGTAVQVPTPSQTLETQPWPGPSAGQKTNAAAMDIMGGSAPVNPTTTIATTAVVEPTAAMENVTIEEAITDEFIRSHIASKNSELLTAQDGNIPEREKQTGRILSLIAEYVGGSAPYPVAKIPQAKRTEFLTRLAALS